MTPITKPINQSGGADSSAKGGSPAGNKGIGGTKEDTEVSDRRTTKVVQPPSPDYLTKQRRRIYLYNSRRNTNAE